MNKTLSSFSTLYYKFCEPLLGAFVVGGMFFGHFFQPNTPMFVKLVFPTITFIAFVLIFWFSWRIKKVILNGDLLVVSDYFLETAISLNNIGKVEEKYSFKRRQIIISLIEPCSFGSTIFFLPSTKFNFDLLKSSTSGQLPEIIQKRKALPQALKSYGMYLIGVAICMASISFELS